jgi:hypothetical protein
MASMHMADDDRRIVVPVVHPPEPPPIMRPDRTGVCVLPVLGYLGGKGLDHTTMTLVYSLRPSSIRIIPPGVGATSDAKLWRVTVWMRESGIDYVIARIEQECEVGLEDEDGSPHGYRNGHELVCALDKRGLAWVAIHALTEAIEVR